MVFRPPRRSGGAAAERVSTGIDLGSTAVDRESTAIDSESTAIDSEANGIDSESNGIDSSRGRNDCTAADKTIVFSNTYGTVRPFSPLPDARCSSCGSCKPVARPRRSSPSGTVGRRLGDAPLRFGPACD
jgi:hypothetical protein